MYASPERRLVFDLNDFDETLPGPFEYDVKRMAASFTIADVTLPKIRYICNPEIPAIQGTTKVAA